MKALGIVSVVLIFVAVAFLGYSYVTHRGIFGNISLHPAAVENAPSSTTDADVGLHASFSNLIDQDGNTVSSTDFSGKHMLVLFGFSSCRRTCPAELGIVSQLLHMMGDAADKLQVVFITIDPERDTVDRLSDYHKAFDSRVRMLTGDAEVLKSVVNNYKVYVGKAEEDGDIAHSLFMYLLDKEGRYVAHFTPDLDEIEGQVEKLFGLVSKYVLNA